MRNLLIVALMAIGFIACNNAGNTEKKETAKTQEEINAISVDSFLVIAPEYVGKELTVKGTVDHVCKHGGKKVKLLGSCSSKSLHGNAAEGVGPFNAELEGSDIYITGLVVEDRVDMEYVNEWEAKVKEAMEKEEEEADMEHKAGTDHHASIEKIADYKKQIEESENGYIAFYSLDVAKFAEKKACCDEEKKDEEKKDKDCDEEKEHEEEHEHEHEHEHADHTH